jgi:type IV pilus assembly protein PilA
LPLSKRNPFRPSRDAGFTLIELLVVIVILGMLAAIAIPAFLGQRRRAVDASIKTDARTVATHLEAFWTERGSYPSPVAVPPDVAFAASTMTIGAETVHLTPDNTPRIYLDGPDRVCVQVLNPRGSDPARGFVWKIGDGGLQPAGSDCTGYATPLL